eukprot:TRINITY_DN12623_c0_g4_i1.p1 TRINITY_DN12623_c0_g4~~TRINITY_DN12623_c0_g4_i1.p1  ORF type:complete len:474 (+),score=82.02 TRINITY_DN12623_c0_g4_i1:505-1926(+)
MATRAERKQLARKRRHTESEHNAVVKILRQCIQAKEASWSSEHRTIVDQHRQLYDKMQKRQTQRLAAQARQQETSDPPDVMKPKIAQVAQLLRASRCCLVYTGAGISAAAGIPTYRGGNGIYNRASKRSKSSAGQAEGESEASNLAEIDITQCHPTQTHMALARLIENKRVRLVVSQNIDNLHRRSGLGWHHLAEIHGNACLEFCPSCRQAPTVPRPDSEPAATGLRGAVSYPRHDEMSVAPVEGDVKPNQAVLRSLTAETRAIANTATNQYLDNGSNSIQQSDPVVNGPDVSLERVFSRRYDVTGRTAKHRHKTGRICPDCSSPLVDSIVHYGEKARCSAIQNWETITTVLPETDLIIAMGSSLKVLHHYKPLWAPLRRPKRQGASAKLIIVNLQWTPRDAMADVVLRCTTDTFVQALHQHAPDVLDCIPPYNIAQDIAWQEASLPDESVLDGLSTSKGWFAKGLAPGKRTK